jgi:hypothetical protein
MKRPTLTVSQSSLLMHNLNFSVPLGRPQEMLKSKAGQRRRQFGKSTMCFDNRTEIDLRIRFSQSSLLDFVFGGSTI